MRGSRATSSGSARTPTAARSSAASTTATSPRSASSSACRRWTAGRGWCTPSRTGRSICARAASRTRAATSGTGLPLRRTAPYSRPMTRQQLTLAATILGSSLAFIDTTVVIVALPTIERELDLGLAGQQWIFLAYSLTLAALYLTGGAVGDRYGRRQTFAFGVIAFAIASALAGAAPGGALLIAARALQGIGGAFLTTNSLALLRATYGDEAGKAIGLWTAFTSVSTIGGPVLGGALIEWVSWRWIFYLNLPLAAATLLLAYRGRTDEKPTPRVGRLDIPGAELAPAGVGP